MKLIAKWLVITLAIMLTSWLAPGVIITGVWSALWLALFLGVINVTIKPFLIAITLPINILTLGLFTFVINALLIMLSATVIKGFFIDGFWFALLFSLILSIISYALHRVFGLKK